MSTAIRDFLEKQLLIEKNVVTFRSLSRQFQLHVNAAKRELATFHSMFQSFSATYIISGEVSQSNKLNSDSGIEEYGMDVDDDEEQSDDAESVSEVKITLVGEEDLERVRSQYIHIYSEHIYSLSPSPLIDAGLICGPSETVYSVDAEASAETAALLGRVTGPHVRLGKAPSAVASSSKIKQRVVKTDAFGDKEKSTAEKTEPKLRTNENKMEDKIEPKQKFRAGSPPPAAKPKATGKLDWSKAKSKDKDTMIANTQRDDNESDEEQGETKVASFQFFKTGPPSKGVKREDSKKAGVSTNEILKVGPPKRGTKREDSEKTGNSEILKVGPPKKIIKREEPDNEILKIGPPKRGAKREDTPKASNNEIIKVGPPRAGSSTVFKVGPPKADSNEISRVGPPKRGTKRKTILLSSDEEDQPYSIPVAVTKSVARILLSDSDEQTSPPPRKIVKKKGKGKRSVLTDTDLEAGKSLRAMMDIDDDEVIKVSRLTRERVSDKEQHDTQEEDIDMSDESEPAPKPKPKKPKKVVPVGRNGLKKKRVLKSVTKMDDAGYMVTEDYSSYESVDEDAQSDSGTKTKGKKAAGLKTKISADDPAPSKPKTKASMKEGQSKGSDNVKGKSVRGTGNQKIMNFFGKGK